MKKYQFLICMLLFVVTLNFLSTESLAAEASINWISGLTAPSLMGYIEETEQVLVRDVWDNGWYLLDMTGKITDILGNLGYDIAAFNLLEGYLEDYAEGMVVVKDKKYGYADKTGKLIIPLEYDYLDNCEGLVCAEKDGKYGYMDRTGKIVIPMVFDDAVGFQDGIAYVSQNGKYGYIDKTGAVVIPLEYDKAWSFSNGLAPVMKDEKWGFIDKTGTVVIPLKYDDVRAFSDDRAAVMKDGKWGYIDKTGTVVIPLKYDDVLTFSDNRAAVMKDGKWGYIDKNGTLIIPLEYDGVGRFADGRASVMKNKKWGYVDENGLIAVPLEYDFAGMFSYGLAEVKKNGAYGCINKIGTEVIPTKYHFLYRLGPHMFVDDIFHLRNGIFINSFDSLQKITETPSSWATEQVKTAINMGIVPENLQTRYTQPITRAEFCALATNLYELTTGKEITERMSFSDTKDINVEKLAGLGIINGVGDGKFSPNGNLNREQAALLICRLLEKMDKPLAKTNPNFADNADISSWAYESVGQVQAAKIMGDVGNGLFSPKGFYTREQSIVTILRLSK